MAQTSSNEIPQSFQCALEEVANITKEIEDLSSSVLTKLQRPMVDTRDHLPCLVKEVWTIFITIKKKISTIHEILKTKLPHDNILDTVAPFSVKLPLPKKLSTPSQTGDLSSPKNIIPKRPVQNTPLPPLVPKTDDNILVRNVSKADNLVLTCLDDVATSDDTKFDDVDNMSAHGNESRLARSSSNPTNTIWTPFLNVNTQQMMQTQASVQYWEHLLGWMCEQRLTDDEDAEGLIKWFFEVLCEEIKACFQRGIKHVDIKTGELNLEMMDLSRFLLEIEKEVTNVRQSQCLPVRGSGPDTILCLDTSASMSGENLRKLIITANQIIDGVEELALHHEIQGNVAVSTFGSQSCVAVHLTNDYSQVRSVIDSLVAEGPSTLYCGLFMAIAACIGNNADVSVNDVRLVPRVIVLTDGKFSDLDAKDENVLFDLKNEIMIPSAANLMKLNGVVCDCVHVGASAESELLQILTKTTNGKIFPDDHVDELIKMPTLLAEATNLIRQFPDIVDRENDTRENEEATLRALLDLESSSRAASRRGFTKSEKETIITLTMNISKLPLTKVAEQQEYLVQELDLQLPPVGTRVRRGPDWDPADNKDSNGPGTVVSHNRNGSVAVLWDCGIIPLPYHCYDPCQILSTEDDERVVREGGSVEVGCKVVRGLDWTHGDEDGGQGSCGIVCLCTRKGTVTVRWPSRKIGKYRYGVEVILLDTSEEQPQASGFDSNIFNIEFELGNKLTNPSDIPHNKKDIKNIDYPTYYARKSDSNAKFLLPKKSNDYSKTAGEVSEVISPKEQECSPAEFQEVTEPEMNTPFLWSYQQEGQVEWTLLSAENIRKLEEDWSKHRKTSIVKVDDKRYRVAFEKMTMSSIEGSDKEKQLKLHVMREQKETQSGKDTED